jgi:hypothetical protein
MSSGMLRREVVEIDGLFRGVYFLRHQVQMVGAVSTSEISVNFYETQHCDATFYQTVIFIPAVVRT